MPELATDLRTIDATKMNPTLVLLHAIARNTDVPDPVRVEARKEYSRLAGVLGASPRTT